MEVSFLPEDLTFLDGKGEVWMSSISHEGMAWINEKSMDEVEFISNDIGLKIYWKEKVYTDDEAIEAISHLNHLIDKYFNLLNKSAASNLKMELSNNENSSNYVFWDEFFSEYNISEHNLAYEIACFSNLLKLKSPIHAFDFSHLLNDLIDNSYLIQLLVKNIDGRSQILYGSLENFKKNYSKENME